VLRRRPRLAGVRDCTDPTAWGPALDDAVQALSRGALIVMPTDTVYGVAADAFDARAVAALLAAKGRDRLKPPPVLVPGVSTLDELCTEIPDAVRDLLEAFWPGALTVILSSRPSLTWDLGETRGTVAVRMPDHPVALALLERTGPLAVSSANLAGHSAALTAVNAQEQLGDSVAVYLDAGTVPGQEASSIVDATGPRLRLVRPGAIDLAALREVTEVEPGPSRRGAPPGVSAVDRKGPVETAGPYGPVPDGDAPA
jgi:L-threonylcarbamoyladenylate synthase